MHKLILTFNTLNSFLVPALKYFIIVAQKYFVCKKGGEIRGYLVPWHKTFSAMAQQKLLQKLEFLTTLQLFKI
jgi:hypothetical protein